MCRSPSLRWGAGSHRGLPPRETGPSPLLSPILSPGISWDGAASVDILEIVLFKAIHHTDLFQWDFSASDNSRMKKGCKITWGVSLWLQLPGPRVLPPGPRSSYGLLKGVCSPLWEFLWLLQFAHHSVGAFHPLQARHRHPLGRKDSSQPLSKPVLLPREPGSSHNWLAHFTWKLHVL